MIGDRVERSSSSLFKISAFEILVPLKIALAQDKYFQEILTHFDITECKILTRSPMMLSKNFGPFCPFAQHLINYYQLNANFGLWSVISAISTIASLVENITGNP